MYLLNMVNTFSYEMNIDTDEDGLCDYIEKEVLKTNYKSKDTDGDGLDDYTEVYLCNTDPLMTDTGETGIKDSDKDIDGDGLTNIEEIKYGTSPTIADTDEDGLDDYNEIKKYSTNPLSKDTDKDGISDLGEITLGLNPLSSKSDNQTLDTKRIFKQELKANSPTLKMINNENNPYEISISIEASCYAEEAINVNISGYSAFLMEDEIYGDIFDIECVSSMEIKNLIINFNLKQISNPKDYMIFFYSDDNRILLPAKTTYNNNILSVSNAEIGTYCIVNIKEMAIYYKETETFNDEFSAETLQITSKSNANYETNTINAVFEIFISNDCKVEAWDKIQNTMISVAEHLETDKKKFKFTLVFTAYGYSVNIDCSSAERLKTICDTATDFFSQNITSSSQAYKIYTTNRAQQIDVWRDLTNAQKAEKNIYSQSFYNNGQMIFTFNNPDIINGKYCGFDIENLCCNAYCRDMIMFSKAFSNLTSNYKRTAIDEKIYNLLTFKNDIPQKSPYRISLFSKILLNNKITPEILNNPNNNISEIKKMIVISESFDNKKSFLYSGLNQFKATTNIDIQNVMVIIVDSDPTKEDTDEDGIPDSEDKNPRKKDYINIDDSLIDDSQIFNKDYIKINNKTVVGNGIANTSSEIKPNIYIHYIKEKYAKNNNSYPALYEIKPLNDSDYKITIDTALDDVCSVIVYEKGILFNRKEISNNIIDNELKCQIDASKNIKHNYYEYTLKSNKTYQIEIVLYAFDTRKNYYDIRIEQDNWVCAKNGGYVTYYSSNPFSTIVYDTKIYLDNETIYNILKKSESFYPVEYPKSFEEFISKTDNFDFCCDLSAEIFSLITIKTDDDDFDRLMTDIGNWASLSGVVLMKFPNLNTLGMAITLAGGGTALYSICSSNSINTKSNIKNAFAEGNFNIIIEKCLNNYPYGEFQYYNGWTENVGFINKYNEFHSRCIELHPFQEYTMIQKNGSKWEIVNE